MRLLLTTDTVGGVWRYTVDLARALAERGQPPVVATLGPGASAAQRAELVGIELVQTGLPLDWTADAPAALDAASEKLAALAALLGVQRVHLHAPALLGRARWPVPVVVVAHSCVGTWWDAMREGPPPPDFAWRIEATGDGLRRAAGVIAPSAAHRAALGRVYGALAVDVVHNGVGDGLPEVAGSRRRAVLTAGRLWDEAKGVAVLDRAAAEIDAPVLAAGPVQGPNGAGITLRHAGHLGTLDAAAMAGQYASATVYASMARYEPFGLAVLEAARAGMRLVLAENPTFRELWDGVAGFTTEAGLAAALRAALDDGPDPRERAAGFKLERTVDGTLAVHGRAAAPPALVQ